MPLILTLPSNTAKVNRSAVLRTTYGNESKGGLELDAR